MRWEGTQGARVKSAQRLCGGGEGKSDAGYGVENLYLKNVDAFVRRAKEGTLGGRDARYPTTSFSNQMHPTNEELFKKFLNKKSEWVNGHGLTKISKKNLQNLTQKIFQDPSEPEGLKFSSKNESVILDLQNFRNNHHKTCTKNSWKQKNQLSKTVTPNYFPQKSAITPKGQKGHSGQGNI